MLEVLNLIFCNHSTLKMDNERNLYMINIKNCFLFLLVLIFTTSKGYSIPKKRALSQTELVFSVNIQ